MGDEVKEKKRKPVPLYPGFPELTRSDVSIYPTYEFLTLDYRVVCRHRYHWNMVMQHKQFTRELRSFELLQPNALGGIRVHREFSDGILSHKIPPPRYQTQIIKDSFTMQERMRVWDILAGKVNFSVK